MEKKKEDKAMTNSNNIKLIGFFVLLLLTCTTLAEFSDFAAFVIDPNGQFGSSPYNDPNAVLAKPATACKNGGINSPPDPNFRVKLVEPAYNVDLNDVEVVTTLKPGDYIIVKFDHKVMDYPGNLYGRDFIVFGNSYFYSVGNVSDSTNMNSCQLTIGGEFEQVIVSVSQNGSGDWYDFNSGPHADALFPTQAHKWDVNSAQWTDEEMDFTRPVDPNLTASDFEYIYAAEAIELYDGSAGGTSFDLKNLTDYNDLAVDPNTGYRWIQYVKLEGAAFYNSEVDAVSDVAACGDPTHPYPAGDITKDCRVDMADFALLSTSWLDCTYNCD